ncbi:MAG: PAS domain-containing protein, partial [bacterium]|nr:PAS domain-containing protein [bacterium]
MSNFFTKTILRRLITIMLLLSLIPLIILGYFTITSFQDSMTETTFSKLESIEHIKNIQIVDYFNQMSIGVAALSKEPSIINGLEEFEIAYASSKKSLESFIKTPEYNAEYKKVDTFLREYSKTYGYYDLFLIDHKGDIIYTVEKEADLGTNLNTGKYSKSNLGQLYKTVMKSKKTCMVDFKPYAPSGDTPASFIGHIIYDFKGKEHGVLAIQIPINQVNKIMQEKTGLGISGETYLVGNDLLMRSDSRFIKNNESSILNTKVETLAVVNALENRPGQSIISDYRGIEVLSSYELVKFSDIKNINIPFKWAIISEIDKAEAFSAMYSLTWQIIIIIIILVIIVVILSIFVANSLACPLRKITAAASQIAGNNLNVDISADARRKDEIGTLSSTLEIMVNNLKKSLLETNEKIENINSLPSPVITIDKEYNITYMNRAGSNLTGFSSTEAIGKKCYDLFKTDHCNTDLCACRQAMEKDNTVTEEAISNPSGNPIDIRYTGTPVKNEDGSIKGALEFFIDISAEKALSQTIIEGAGKLSATITEITSTISQLAANTTETSSAINEITTTVTEVRQVSEVAHERAVEVTEKAEQVNTTTDTGKKATEDTIDGILKIKEEMASIAESTIKLGEQTQNIGEIISSVNGLADQSNLLSVNASIEAAKAGEYGKGFAVVAREVKALADQSKSATKQINSILTDIQKATSSAVMATERGTNAVASGQELSATAGETITLLAEG